MINIVNNSNKEHVNVITHGGIFHADEVMATVILHKLLGILYILRVFSIPEDISNNVIIYDIGGGKFDHHQRGGNGTRKNGVPYSSAGLIWKEYGMSYLSKILTLEIAKQVWETIDECLIQGIDAIDNGVLPRLDYPAQEFGFSSIVSSFNPNWDDTTSPDEAFIEAINFAETVFDKVLSSAISKANAKEIVEKAIAESKEGIMILDRYVPWQEYIFDSENPVANDILFVIFPSNRGGFNWQCVPDAPGSFGQRKPVPDSWKGLRDKDLQSETGVATAVFCHPAGFIGSAEVLEDSIKLAKMAIEA